jgi:hypothetical protein
MSVTPAPVVLFVYNRPEHTRRTIEALRMNRGVAETDLRVYSDAPTDDRQREAVQLVRSIIRSIEGFNSVSITERDKNWGLAASVIAGVTETLDEHAYAIVVEDDLVTAPNFLAFMNAALATYAPRKDIFSVTGYNYPLRIPDDYPEDTYLSYRSSSWGWGTWPDRWGKVDWVVSDFAELMRDKAAQSRFARGGDDLLPMLQKQLAGELDSWSIRFAYAHYKHDAFCLHPVRSKLVNIGFDGTGVHCDISSDYDVELDTGERGFTLRPDVRLDPVILRFFDQRFRPRSAGTPMQRAKCFVKQAVRRLARSVGAV